MRPGDRRNCEICEKAIGDAPAVLCRDTQFHETCLPECSICKEPFKAGEDITDPGAEPYRLLDFVNKPAHIECCREAAWQAMDGRSSANHEYQRGMPK